MNISRSLQDQSSTVATDALTRTSMEWSMASCSTTLESGVKITDRISNLHDDLLSQILSVLQTKEAFALSVSSKTMMKRVFGLITSLDFDDSPISHCLKCTHLIELYPTYKHFVDTVLRACQSSHDKRHMTRFKLRLGRIHTIANKKYYGAHTCSDFKQDDSCFPQLDPEQLNAWICYPLTRKVRELDLSIHVRAKPRGKLPSEIFTCETLEVLKLDLNLETQESYSCLPNLKVLHLSSIVIGDDEFVTRLVSSCPSLTDFTLQHCTWRHEDFITISSRSLWRLVLNMMEGTWYRKTHELEPSQVVLIDTPNLQLLSYTDNLACQYSITNMNAINTAQIAISYVLQNYEHEDSSFQSMLSIVRGLSNVQQLSLYDSCIEALDSGVLKDQLPIFSNLKCLELGYNSFANWDQVLLGFLHCSPFLVTLVFPEGLYHGCPRIHTAAEEMQAVELELQAWKTTQIPSSCRSHLKRIVIKFYFGSEREINLIAFLLRNAFVLEELVVYQRPPNVDQMLLERTLKNLPKASNNCSISVH